MRRDIDKARIGGFSFICVVMSLLSGVVNAAPSTDYDFKLHVYPNPFVPGYEKGSLYYVLPAGGTASLFVYDFNGHLVRTVFSGDKRSRGESEGEDYWDGLDDDGKMVSPGAYLMYFEVVIEGTRYRDSFVTVVNR